MLKLKQAELEEIKEVRKSVFGDADFDDEGLCLHVLARDGDEKAGCVSLKKDGDFVRIYALGVNEKLRGKMTGEALLKMAEFLSLNRDCRETYVTVGQNAGFFEKFGYKKTSGDRMEKSLFDGCNCCSHNSD